MLTYYNRNQCPSEFSGFLKAVLSAVLPQETVDKA